MKDEKYMEMLEEQARYVAEKVKDEALLAVERVRKLKEQARCATTQVEQAALVMRSEYEVERLDDFVAWQKKEFKRIRESAEALR